jgi:hypothetical protein
MYNTFGMFREFNNITNGHFEKYLFNLEGELNFKLMTKNFIEQLLIDIWTDGYNKGIDNSHNDNPFSIGDNYKGW